VVIYKIKYAEYYAGCDYQEFSFIDSDNLGLCDYYSMRDKSNGKMEGRFRPIFWQNWRDCDGYDYGGYGVVRV
jgi:hypothetical protein